MFCVVILTVFGWLGAEFLKPRPQDPLVQSRPEELSFLAGDASLTFGR